MIRNFPRSKCDSLLAYILLVPILIFLGWIIARQRVSMGVLFGGFGVLATSLVFLRVPARRRGVMALGIASFLITGYPVARIMVGAMPLYFVDVLIVVAILEALSGKKPNWKAVSPLPQLIVGYMLLTFASSLHEMWLTDVILQPTYMLIRYVLSMSLALLVPILVRTRHDLIIVLWGLMFGMLLTAVLGILQSLPIPNNPIREVVIPSLFPINERLYELRFLQGQHPSRAFSLVGVATVTGAVIAMVWPLGLGMYTADEFKARRRLLWLILVIGLAGAATTYSRFTYLSFALVLVALQLVRTGRRTRRIWAGFLILLLVFTIGQSAGYFQFDVPLKKTLAGEDFYSNRARIEAYKEMFPFLEAHPLWLVVGRGLAWSKLSARGLINPYEWFYLMYTENHNTWAIVIYQRGLLAALLLTLAMIVAFRKVRRHLHLYRVNSPSLIWFPSVLYLVFIAMVPVWLASHVFGDAIHVQSLLFIILGLVMILPEILFDSTQSA